MRVPILAAVGTLLALVALAGIAGAQSNAEGFKRCGDPDLVLVFMNPDLRVQDDGFIHASGTFFIQFQARGEKAFDIETFKFSFGPYVDGFEPDLCNPARDVAVQEHVTGLYLKNYRADYEPRDGFHIPINTCLVPNSRYAAAVSAYDANQRELVRYYAKAVVQNGDYDTATSAQQSSAQRCQNPDTTAPWPIILPGDGERLDGGQGLYIEVGEPVASIQALLNGKPIQLTEGLGEPRDDDLVPDLGYHPTVRDTPLANSQVQSRQYPAFTWDGVLTQNDVVKVRVTDAWGNVAEKVVHLGDPTIGGRVTLTAPEFELEIPERDLTADRNGTAVYNVTYRTKNDEGLHADLFVESASGGPLPAGIDYRLNPDHVMMGGNKELQGQILLFAKPEVQPGVYQVVFIADYLNGDAREQKKVPLTFRVEAAPEESYDENEEYASKEKATQQQNVREGDAEPLLKTEVKQEEMPVEEKSKIPAPPATLAVLVAALLALARRQRR